MGLEKFDVSKEIKILKKWEDDSRKDRALRLQFVMSQDYVGHFLGDALFFYYYIEAKTSYVNGCFGACIVMCQMAIERGIKFWYMDNSLDKKSFFDILKIAEKDKLLKKSEADKLHKLRKNRNPYVHSDFSSGIDINYIIKEKISKELNIEITKVEKDAKESFKILMAFIKRRL